MKIIKYGGELKQVNRVLIYGMGVYGKRLYEEILCCEGTKELFVCDVNKRACLGFLNYVPKEKLKQFMQDNGDAIIVISIKAENIVEDVHDEVVNMGWEKEKIYRYIPETKEEFVSRKIHEGFFNGEKTNFLMENYQADKLIEDKIVSKSPFLVARWGSVEGAAVMHSRIGMLSELDLHEMCNNAGVFPINDSLVKKYVNITELAAAQMDVMCVGFWCRKIESLYRIYSPEAVLISNGLLPPCNASWIGALKYKSVLVIHPFAPLIEEQYKRREKLFEDVRILPEFKLRTYQAIQSQGGTSKYASWVDAFEKMKEDIAKIDFDISLIGCGAYGMPLGAFIKEVLKKQAIHVGGQLQLLFGIKGKRWDMRKDTSVLYNQYWIRPTEELRPKNYMDIENGCYW